jgi:hypothetical protein
VIGTQKGALWAGVEAGKRLMGEGTINTKHGTGAEGSLHLCTEGYNLKLGFLSFHYRYTSDNYSLYICCKHAPMLFIFFSSASYKKTT